MPKGTRRAPDRGANEEIALRVASYRPRTIDESLWAAIQPFVLSCASELPLAGWASATRTLRVLVQVALWARGRASPWTGSWSSIPTLSSALSPSRRAPMLREPPTERFFAASDPF